MSANTRAARYSRARRHFRGRVTFDVYQCLSRRSGPSVAEHGMAIYGHVEANLNWELFLFLGKLDPLIYLLRFPPSADGSTP